MKIESLSITGKYKNIENLNFEFSDDKNIALLVGQNGVGKSNLIEIIALIFRDLELMSEKEFLQWGYENFGFLMDYQCKGNHIQINIYLGMVNIFVRPFKSDINESKEISIKEFIERRKKDFLPNYIIGYYSGENKRLKGIIEDYKDNELEALKNWNKKEDKNIEPFFRRFFFTETHHSVLVLLTLFLFKSTKLVIGNTKLSEKIDLLLNHLKIENFVDLNLIFNNPDWVDYYERNKLGVSFLLSNLMNDVKNPFWSLKGKINDFLSFLIDNHVENPIGYPQKDKIYEHIQEVLEFNNLDVAELVKNCPNYYKKPLDFFDAIESTTFVNILYKIIIKAKKVGIPDFIEFSEFSEGEQQLITTIGLLLLTCQDDCLYLFDEPDTHLNPQWQRNYIKLLNEFNLNGNNSQIFVATHSPLIVQAAEDADTFLFRFNKKGGVDVDYDDFKIHNWRIDQVLASDYFGFENTRNPQIDSFMKRREKLLSKPELDSEDIQWLEDWEETVGVLPSGETLNDFKAIQLVRSIVNQSQKSDKN